VGQAVYPLRTLRMPKVLCLAGMVIAILILVLFLLDLAIKFPFQRINTLMDVVFVICAVALGYVSWSTLREQD
jgi:hypothetical protein